MAVLPTSLGPAMENHFRGGDVGKTKAKCESWIVTDDPFSFGVLSWRWLLPWPCGASYVLPSIVKAPWWDLPGMLANHDPRAFTTSTRDFALSDEAAGE